MYVTTEFNAFAHCQQFYFNIFFFGELYDTSDLHGSSEHVQFFRLSEKRERIEKKKKNRSLLILPFSNLTLVQTAATPHSCPNITKSTFHDQWPPKFREGEGRGGRVFSSFLTFKTKTSTGNSSLV